VTKKSVAKKKPQWQDQLNLCLDTAEEASKPWARGVRAAIFKNRTPIFKQNEKVFEKNRKEILRGSELTGIVARACADFEKKHSVSVRDMMAGIAAAKYICTAGAKATTGVEPFFLWCG